MIIAGDRWLVALVVFKLDQGHSSITAAVNSRLVELRVILRELP